MYVSLFLIDFVTFQTEHVTGDSYEISSEESTRPFRLRTGRARPVRIDADRVLIGAEAIESRGWIYKREPGSDPVDDWDRLDDQTYSLVVKYIGITPPDGGAGYYNLVLPPGWHFQYLEINNPNYYTIPDYQIAIDDASNREALRLDFQGPRAQFDINARVGTDKSQIHCKLENASKATIVEPNCL